MEVVEYRNFDSLKVDWDGLADAVHASPFARPGWLAAWWAAFSHGTPPVVLGVRRAGALVALLPLEQRRGALRSVSNWHSASSGLLAADPEAASALAEAVFARRPRSVHVAFLDPGRPGVAEFKARATDARYRTLTRVVERPPFAVLEGSWEQFHAGLSKNLRADAGRRLRRLQEAGDVQLELHDGSERLDDLLAEGFAIEAAGWKAERGTAIVSRPETQLFYTEASRWAAEQGFLQLAFLRLDGAATAFQLNIVAGGVHYHVKGGYDPAYQRFSPGKLMHRLLIERAFAERIVRYEFLGADEDYKLQWATGLRELELLQAFRRTPPGLAEWTGYAYGRPAARRALEIVKQRRRSR